MGAVFLLSQSVWDAATVDIPSLTQASHLASMSRCKPKAISVQWLRSQQRGLWPLPWETQEIFQRWTAHKAASRLRSRLGLSKDNRPHWYQTYGHSHNKKQNWSWSQCLLSATGVPQANIVFKASTKCSQKKITFKCLGLSSQVKCSTHLVFNIFQPIRSLPNIL